MRRRMVVAAAATLIAACGGKETTNADPAPAAQCKATPADTGNCFSTYRVDSASACGLPSGPGTSAGATCQGICGTGVKCCGLESANVVRCEYCACP